MFTVTGRGVYSSTLLLPYERIAIIIQAPISSCASDRRIARGANLRSCRWQAAAAPGAGDDVRVCGLGGIST